MDKPLVSVLVLTYNGLNLLKDCLDSVLKSNYPNLEIIVSDNESTDDIDGFIRKNYSNKQISVYRLKKNKGLTGGFNFGYQFCKGKYVMLLCNDTKVNKDTISELVKVAESDDEIGAVAPLVVQMKHPDLIHSAGSFLTHMGILYHYGVYKKKDKNMYRKNYFIFSTTGAGFLVRKSAVDKTGLYSEDFFMAYDESDLCHRLWLGGYTIVYCSKAELQHLWSATMDSTKPILWFWNQRNFISSILINFEFINCLYWLVMVNICFIFWSLLALRRGQLEQALTLPKAWWWHLTHLSETFKQRRYVQESVRKVSDRWIFKRALYDPSWRYYLLHLKHVFNDRPLPKRFLYPIIS